MSNETTPSYSNILDKNQLVEDITTGILSSDTYLISNKDIQIYTEMYVLNIHRKV